MESLRKKLGVLREAQRGLQDDIRANTQLGLEVGRSFVLSFMHLFAQIPAEIAALPWPESVTLDLV